MPEKGKSNETAPNGAARKMSLPKRFYEDVSVKDEERGGASLQLDGKPVRTPGKAALTLPTRALAEAIAAEWRAQGERIDPSTMPLTRLANSAIDGVVGREQAVVDDIARHAGSDLVCYRAEGPKALVEAQRVHWDPVLAFARDELKAPLILSEGVVHVAQPDETIAALRATIPAGPWRLGALSVITTLTGSGLLALALERGAIEPEAAWAAAHVDEDWQIAQWGRDDDALERRAYRRAEFEAATTVLRLTK